MKFLRSRTSHLHFTKTDIVNVVSCGHIKMPKEFHEFDMTKPPGASWGIRIGGGVDRGKVLVLEKVRQKHAACTALSLDM